MYLLKLESKPFKIWAIDERSGKKNKRRNKVQHILSFVKIFCKRNWLLDADKFFLEFHILTNKMYLPRKIKENLGKRRLTTCKA